MSEFAFDRRHPSVDAGLSALGLRPNQSSDACDRLLEQDPGKYMQDLRRAGQIELLLDGADFSLVEFADFDLHLNRDGAEGYSVTQVSKDGEQTLAYFSLNQNGNLINLQGQGFEVALNALLSEADAA